MGKRSRLRTQGVRRRRLFLIAPVLCVVLGGIVWYGSAAKAPWLEQVRAFFSRDGSRSPQRFDLVRGTIYDRNYKELAVSYERVSVYANIREISDLEQVVVPLSAVLEESREVLYERLSGNTLRLWLARDISQEQEERIRQLDLPGIFLHKEHVRYHPRREAAAHLLGFVENDAGLAGIEFYLNQLQNRHEIYGSRPDNLPLVGDGRPGPDGRHLILTLDLKIQQILERYLETHPGRARGLKVGALVLEADSGALVGYAQIPSFDPNRFHTYPETVFTDVFDETMAAPEPFKIFLRDLSLLESQSDHHRPPLPWSVAAEKRKLGIQLQLWEKLGAGGQERYDFISAPSVMSERVAHDESGAASRDFETVPVMQTPLRLLTAITRSLNGGVRVMPHAADRYVLRRNQSEYLLEEFGRPKTGELLHDGVSAEARRLFRAEALAGPLDSALLEGHSVSYRMDAGVKSFREHDILVAAVPARQPELLLMVVASGPGYEPDANMTTTLAAEAAALIAPIAALQQVMKNLADMMRPREAEETNYRFPQDGPAPGVPESGPAVLPALVEMPQLRGMSLRKCLRLLQGVGVEIEISGSGRVVDQEPPPGEPLRPGTRVALILERDKVDAGFKTKADR